MTRPPSKKSKQPVGTSRIGMVSWRWKSLAVLVLGAWAALSVRLVWVQVINHPVYGDIADGQYDDLLIIEANRGTIYDCRGRALAIDLPNFYAVGAVPGSLLKESGATTRLSQALNIPKSRLIERLRTNTPFVWVVRGVDEHTAQSVTALNLAGIRLVRETKRTYPFGHIAGQLLGTTDSDRVGIAGLEHYFDSVLGGRSRKVPCWTDARGQVKVASDDRAAVPRGQDITLTINLVAQCIAEEELAAAAQSFDADWGVVVMTDPGTGEIIALATYPLFDPNIPQHIPVDRQRCRAVTDMYEPGSTFKITVAAAALQSGKVSPRDTFDCENGRAVIAGRVFRDAHPHGLLSFRDIFTVSSNIGMAKIGQVLGPELLYKTARDFGFGEPTEIDLEGEARGILHPPARWSGSSLSNFCIGQGVSATAIQLAMAYGAIANGGKLLKPQLVVPDHGRQEVRPVKIRDVFSREIADSLTSLMVGVVEHGTGKPAAIEGITVAAKTGTAQKVDTANGTYFQDRFVASFVGFLPAENPRYLTLVIIDDPQREHYGSQVAAPCFKRIMTRWLAAQRSSQIPSEIPHPATDLVQLNSDPGDSPPKGNLKAVRSETAPPDVMPSLVGIPMRSAIRELTFRGMNVSAAGYGMVKNQQPRPGTTVKPGTRCRLTGDKTS